MVDFPVFIDRYCSPRLVSIMYAPLCTNNTLCTEVKKRATLFTQVGIVFEHFCCRIIFFVGIHLYIDDTPRERERELKEDDNEKNYPNLKQLTAMTHKFYGLMIIVVFLLWCVSSFVCFFFHSHPVCIFIHL